MEDENSSNFLVRRAVATQLSPTINLRKLFHVYAVIYQPRLLLLLSAVYFRLEIYLRSHISPELERNYVHARILFYFKRDLPARIGSVMEENGKVMGNEVRIGKRKLVGRMDRVDIHISKNSCN